MALTVSDILSAALHHGGCWTIRDLAEIVDFPDTKSLQIRIGRLMQKGLIAGEKPDGDRAFVYHITDAGIDAARATITPSDPDPLTETLMTESIAADCALADAAESLTSYTPESISDALRREAELLRTRYVLDRQQDALLVLRTLADHHESDLPAFSGELARIADWLEAV